MEDTDDHLDFDLDLAIDANKEEFSDLNCDSENGAEAEENLCFYCDQVLSRETTKQHFLEKHRIEKNLEFLCKVTSDKQEEDKIGAVAVSPEPLQQENKKDELDDVSDIESEEDQDNSQPISNNKVMVEEGEKEKVDENIKMIRLDLSSEDIDDDAKKSDSHIGRDGGGEEAEDEGKDDKRDWMYSAEKAESDISEEDATASSKDEKKVESKGGDLCHKCDVNHAVGTRCHFNLKFSKSTYIAPIGKDTSKKTKKSQKGKQQPVSSTRKTLSAPRKSRIAPPDPRIESRSPSARKVRTLPPSLYNNPDALSSDRKMSRSPDDRRKSESHDDRYRGRNSSRRSRSRSPRDRMFPMRSPSPSPDRYLRDSYDSREDRSYSKSSRFYGSPDRDNIRCDLCDSKNHRTVECLQLFCYLCNKQGHHAKNCQTVTSHELSTQRPVPSPYSVPPPLLPSSHHVPQASLNSASDTFHSTHSNPTMFANRLSTSSVMNCPSTAYTEGYMPSYPSEGYSVSRDSSQPLVEPSYLTFGKAIESSSISSVKNRENILTELSHLQFFIASKVSQIEGYSYSYGNSVGTTAVEILADNDYGLRILKELIDKRGFEHVGMQIKNAFRNNNSISEMKTRSFFENLVTNLVLQYLSRC